MTVHTTGDSHSNAAWDKDVIRHELGPCLCYSFGRDKLDRCDIRKFNLKDGDTLIFCLGEIDCRCHIHKYVSDTTSYQTIIDDIVINYIDAILLNIKTAKVKLKNVCVYNVVPPVNKHNTADNPSFPFLGTDDERKAYVLYFNKKLKELCNQNSLVFFDIYDKYIDSNGFLRKDMSDDNVHIVDGKYIRDFLSFIVNDGI